MNTTPPESDLPPDQDQVARCSRCDSELLPDESEETCPRCLVAQALTPNPECGLSGEDVAAWASEGTTWADEFPHLKLGARVALEEGVDGFCAEDLERGEAVFLMLVTRERLRASGGPQAWEQGYRLLRQIQHPHMARVLDFGTLGNRFYVVLEQAAGRPLSECEATLSPDKLEAMMQQVQAGMAQANAVGLTLSLHLSEIYLAENQGQAVLLPLLGRSSSEVPQVNQPSSTKIDVGLTVGPYQMVQRLGEGGFAEVWLAQQDEPVRRRVAFKIIKQGMDTERVLARFEAERQALALLEHPHIARVYDAGSTESGRPYFIMEAVDGQPIDLYCDQSKASIEARLRLLIDICQAVQHAHQKGIIHRDLKPSNILVARDGEGEAVAKVIDFGIAKAIDQSLSAQTIYTREHQIIGTPDYMSPEQRKRGGRAVDSRSDVYSLGILLYELLTGSTPFRLSEQSNDSDGSGTASWQRGASDDREVPKPSTRLAEGRGTTRTEVSAWRLSKESFPRELDWIVLRALESDPERRYQSATQLGDDLRRFLNHEAVEAGPPTKVYQMRKFVRRHRVAVASGLAVVSALVIGMGLALVGFFRAEASEELARSEAQTSQAINRFLLEDLLEQADPFESSNRDLKMIDAVDRAAEKVGERFADQPLVEAEVRLTLAQIYNSLGDFQDKALPNAVRAAELLERHLGPEHRKTLKARSLTLIYSPKHLDPSDRLQSLESLFSKQSEQLGLLDEDTLDTFQAIISQHFENSGDVYSLTGAVGTALARIRDEFDQVFLKASSLNAKETLIYIRVYANTKHSRWMEPSPANLDRELYLMRRALELAENHFGSHHATTLYARVGLGIVLMEYRRNTVSFDKVAIEEKLTEAEVLFRSVLTEATPLFGEASAMVIDARAKLVEVLKANEDWEEVLQLEREEFDYYQAETGEFSVETLRALLDLVEASHGVHRRLSDNDEQIASERLAEEYEPLFDRLRTELLNRSMESPSNEVALALLNLGDAFGTYELKMGREEFPETIELYARSLAVHEQLGDAFDSSIAWAHRRLGEFYKAQLSRGRAPEFSYQAALTHCHKAIEIAEAIGEEPSFISHCLTLLGGLYEISGRSDGIDTTLRDWAQDPTHARYAVECLTRIGKFAEGSRLSETLQPNPERGGRYSNLHRATVYALMADDVDRHEELISELKSRLLDALSEPETANLSLHENQGGQFTLLLHDHRGLTHEIASSAPTLVPKNAGCEGCKQVFLTLAAYRSGDLEAGKKRLQDHVLPEKPKRCEFSRTAATFLTAMMAHDEGNAGQARTQLDEGWEGLESYFSRQWHMKPSYMAPTLSILAIEARRKITGESLPNDHFWRQWEDSRAISKTALRLIDRGAEWRYLHPVDGVDPALADEDFHQTFFRRDFDDGSWSVAREDDGPLSGFGYGDPVAVRWDQPDKGLRKTAYLRCHFTTNEEVSDLRLRMQCDDGAIVYLDGQEVGRISIPGNAPDRYELMTGKEFLASGWQEEHWRVVQIERSLPAGDHVLTISLHNATPDSSDLRIGNIVLYGTPLRAGDQSATFR